MVHRVFSYYPMKIGDFVSIGPGSIVEAASIGNGVEIGKNCIIVSPCASCQKSFLYGWDAWELLSWSWTRRPADRDFDPLTLQESLAIIKDNAKIADYSVVAAGTIVPSLGEWGGSPGALTSWGHHGRDREPTLSPLARPIGSLPESTPELIEAKAKAFYARFQPE